MAESVNIMNVNDDYKFNETRLALGTSDVNLLDIFQYIQAVKFEIDTFMLDKFWQCVNENRSASISRTILNWLGYENKHEHDSKSHFIELLKSHNIEYTPNTQIQISQNIPNWLRKQKPFHKTR
ncbi:132L [Cherax quadricarinatus iridovirus]|uniref:MSV199 domain-containing protein n=1 Tax=Shrimp hemocyte iridescent virus TaxID=2039780 RepID=A0A291B0L4_9VIRU|nr:132L [Cherax quadricarinatus iridovirus]YP_010084776.1 hypothetical protein KM509_gp024 [Shrimp hemocyte iridescent virus]UPA43279.1 hypothetical protein 4TH000005 [Iridovirus CN01]ASZ85112.1 132L [Cherax quadricarinatus iridovirus]ATE87033.1 hypothetical protein [Shrimp hemocyte iridescent virus]UPA43514.1 hypothetical protein 3TG000081 [Iridovirus CN01]UPA43711.1 hypothetical protein 1DG000119 [Iridovirus CN01]